MGFLTFQVNVAPALPVPSPAVTVTLYGPGAAAPAATVPVMAPVPVLIFSPGGSPTAEYDSVPLLLSLALSDSDTEAPSALVWLPGLVRVTGLLTFQVNVALALALPSLAVT